VDAGARVEVPGDHDRHVFRGGGADAVPVQDRAQGIHSDQDTDQINLQLVAAQGTSFYKMVDYQKAVADIIRKDPNVDTFMGSVGGGFGGQSGNNAQMNILLKPANERTRSMAQIMDKLQAADRDSGFQAFMRIPRPSTSGAGIAGGYELTVLSGDTDALAKESTKLLAAWKRKRRCGGRQHGPSSEKPARKRGCGPRPRGVAQPERKLH